MIITHRGILLEEDETNTRSVTGEVELPFDRLERALKIAHSIRYDAMSSIAVKYALKVMEERQEVYPVTERGKEKYGQDGEARIYGNDYLYSTAVNLSKERSGNEAILHTLTNAVVAVTKESIHGGFCGISCGGAQVYARVMCEYNDILAIKLSARNRLIEAVRLSKITGDLKQIDCIIIETSDAEQPWGQYLTNFHIRSIGKKLTKVREDEITGRLLKSVMELGIDCSLEDTWTEVN